MRTMNAAPTPRRGEGVLPRFHVKPRDIQSFAVAIGFKGPCVSTKPTHMMTFSESWFLTLPPSKRRRHALRAYLCMDVNVPRRFRFDLHTSLRSAGLFNVIRAHIQQPLARPSRLVPFQHAFFVQRFGFTVTDADYASIGSQNAHSMAARQYLPCFT